MKKIAAQILAGLLCALALISTSCFGAFFEKPTSNLTGTTTVRVTLGDLQNPLGSSTETISSSRIIAPPPLTLPNTWNKLEVSVRDKNETLVGDVKTITSGTVADFTGLSIGEAYTFSMRLLLEDAEIANGFQTYTPNGVSDSVTVPVKRLRSEGGTGSFSATIEFTDGANIGGLSVDLYRVRPGSLVQEEMDQMDMPYSSELDEETGKKSLIINWKNLSSGTYLLIVAAEVENSANRIALGDDALVEIFDGCESVTNLIAYDSSDLLNAAVRYYVSTSGDAAYSGRFPHQATTFAKAITSANSNTLVSIERPARIFLLSDVSIDEEQTITCPVHISSLTNDKTLSASSQFYGPALLSLGAYEVPASVTLNNIQVTAGTSSAPSGLIVVKNGSLVLGTGSVLSGNVGGGVAMRETDGPSSITLAGGTIRDCTAEGTGDGGGIFALKGTVYLNSGSIINCTARNGGGIWIGDLCTVERIGLGTLSFTNNTAEVGGAMAFHSAVTTIPADLASYCDSNNASLVFPNLARVYAGSDESIVDAAITDSEVVPSFISFYLDLTLTTPKNITGRVAFSGSGSTITRAANFNRQMDPTFLVTGANAELIFSGVILTAEALAKPEAAYISVIDGAHCYLNDESKITGLTVAIEVSGLGVFINEGGILEINNSQITSCSTPGNGGAVYVGTDSHLILKGALTDLSGNQAASGGAIYAESPVDFYNSLTPGFIHDNTATVNSGGFHHNQANPKIKIDGALTLNFQPILPYFGQNSANATTSYKSTNLGHIVRFKIGPTPFVIDDTLSALVMEGAQAIQPTTPLKADYEFAGWYTDTGYLNLFNFENIIQSDLILYAKMVTEAEIVTAITYNVDPYGGSDKYLIGEALTAAAQNPLVNIERPALLVLQDNISLSSTKTITCPVHISSKSGEVYELTRSVSFPGGSSTFTVSGSGAQLILSGVKLNAISGAPQMTVPYIVVTEGAYCSLQNNAVIQDLETTSPVNGLGVNVSGPGSKLEIIDSQIISCKTASNGGAVYVDSLAQLTIAGEFTVLSGNEAATGGAIYTNNAIEFGNNLSPSCINNNTATMNSGAIFDGQSTPQIKFEGINRVPSQFPWQVLQAFGSNNTAPEETYTYKTVNWGRMITYMRCTGINGQSIREYVSIPIQEVAQFTLAGSSFTPPPIAGYGPLGAFTPLGWSTTAQTYAQWNINPVSKDVTVYAFFQ